MATILEPKFLTAEEYGRLPDDGRFTELVRGRIVEMNRPFTSQGYLMSRLNALLWQYVDPHGWAEWSVVTLVLSLSVILTRFVDLIWRFTVINEFHQVNYRPATSQPVQNL